MSESLEKVPSLTPKEKQARKLRGLRKFRAVGRLVIANLYWLNDVRDANIGNNVMQNIQILTRRKVKKSSLTLQEKAILSKPKEERTEEEKLILYKVIGGLKCFRRYPVEVKSQLAAVTYFVYFGTGRQIVKQDHVPLALYFMLSGEASVTVRHYDKHLDEWTEEDSGVLTPGTMFGEIALLHGIARLATITTTTPCELLMIKKEDFDSVLKETVLKAWTEIQKIMNELSYFKSWDSMTKIECSTLSRTKSFAPEETILGDDIGSPTFVYFITKGTCCIIENLEVMVINVKGIEKYRLLNGEAVQTDGSEDTVSAIFDKYLNKDLKSEFGFRDWRKDDSSDKLIGSMTQTGGMSAFSSAPSKTMRTETHFINVCELRKGACFNVGENFQRRRIVATTPTHCLLVPRYWIMKNNSDNIWNRVQQFLNKHIPTSEQIFDNFIHERKFKRYRKGLVKDLLAEKKVANTNTIHNVPYSIRLKEGVDVDYS